MNAKRMLLSTALLLAISAAPLFGQDRLLIIAPDEFVEQLEPLKRFKDASGRPTTLLSLEQVYESFSGVDNPERIKNGIAYYESTAGIDHVMLVGDIDKFPARWRWWGRWMPDDPWFEGIWSVVPPGVYRQSNETDQKAFCSWVDLGLYNQYVIEVDCTPISGHATARQTRVHFADAEWPDGRFRVELRPEDLELRMCEVTHSTDYAFALETTYHIKIELTVDRVKVWVDSEPLPQLDEPLRSVVRPGQIGLGTWLCSAEFDNLVVTTDDGGTLLLSEDFDDYVADGFHVATNMSERNWAVSDLYYADLYEQDGPPWVFDDWDLTNNGLYGEIEWELDPNNCDPNCNTLNNDHIDFLPDVSVGRIPASTPEEVTRYVNKLIGYEMATTNEPNGWFKKAVLYEGSRNQGAANDSIAAFLQQPPPGPGFTVTNHHWAGELELMDPDDRRDLVASEFNQGAGLINYLGHGDFDRWSCLNFKSNDVTNLLANYGKLPVVFAGACFTGQFSPWPAWDPYTDIDGDEHSGIWTTCEPFPSDPAAEAPMGLQEYHDHSCIAESFLFDAGTPTGSAGAVVYLGARTAAKWDADLSEFFFKAYLDDTTVGDMWKKMMEDYYWDKNLDQSHTWVLSPAEHETGQMFDEPQKLVLFGDPSVVVGGAFNAALSGDVYDGYGGPLDSYSRHRVIGDVTVPTGTVLTALPAASMLFEGGRKLTGMGSGSAEGFSVTGTPAEPVHLMSLAPDPPADYVVHRVKVVGQLRLRNGGEIKLY